MPRPRRGRKFRYNELQDMLKRHGLFIERWTPGDGVARYKFVEADTREVYTALGILEAEVFATGYVMGRESITG